MGATDRVFALRIWGEYLILAGHPKQTPFWLCHSTAEKGGGDFGIRWVALVPPPPRVAIGNDDRRNLPMGVSSDKANWIWDMERDKSLGRFNRPTSCTRCRTRR